MPLRVSALTADRRSLKVAFDAGDLTIVYRPSTINAIQEEREIEDKAAGKPLLAVNRSLVEMIASWDLLDDDGNPLPVTEEALRPLGLDVTQHLYNEIIRDALPNRTRQTGSRSGSSAAASSEAAPTGTQTS